MYKTQIIRDLNEDEANELGPMNFFKHYSKNFPKLTNVAKSIFCITATSVPAEPILSKVGIIQNE